ncbi:MAG: RodZ domain-containing protein [Candidatus Sulfotelmatobacter sp.]
MSYDDSVIACEGHFAAPGALVGEFGNKFRKEREKQGISLEDVSNATKIGSRMLRAIEDEQFDRLPGGVFNKGFIRAYAKHLGLNDDQAVNDYLACLRQSQVDAQDVWDPQAHAAAPERRQPGSSDRRQGSPPSPDSEELPELQLPRAEHVAPRRRDYLDRGDRAIPWRILALAVLVVVLGVLLWNRPSRSGHTRLAPAAPVTSPAQTPTQPPNPSAHAAAATSPVPTPARPATPKSPSSGTTAAPPRPITAVAVKSAVTAGTESNNQENGVPAAQPDQAANPPAEGQAPAAAAAAESPAPLNLVIRASENSWISVSADGQSVLHETLIAPAHTSVHAAREIVLRIGNAAGVTFLWNGNELPAQGAEAEVKTLVFDASGMREVPSTPSPTQNR